MTLWKIQRHWLPNDLHIELFARLPYCAGTCDSFTDVALAAFIEALRVNSTLEVLFIQVPPLHERDRISLTLTLEGLEAYVGLLCDTTNVQATRYSNHTLYHIGHLEPMQWCRCG